MGFSGCSARQPSWQSEFSEFSVAGGWLTGWLDQVAVPDLWYQSQAAAAAAAAAATTVCCDALPLSSPPLIPPPPWSLSQHKSHSVLQLGLCFYPSILQPPAASPLYPLLFLKLTCTHSAVADRQTVRALLWMASSCTSGGSVRSSVALSPLSWEWLTQHCREWQSARQSDRPTATVQTDRRVCRAYRQTTQGKTDREADSLWQIQPAYNTGRQLANLEETCN